MYFYLNQTEKKENSKSESKTNFARKMGRKMKSENRDRKKIDNNDIQKIRLTGAYSGICTGGGLYVF